MPWKQPNVPFEQTSAHPYMPFLWQHTPGSDSGSRQNKALSHGRTELGCLDHAAGPCCCPWSSGTG